MLTQRITRGCKKPLDFSNVILDPICTALYFSFVCSSLSSLIVCHKNESLKIPQRKLLTKNTSMKLYSTPSAIRNQAVPNTNIQKMEPAGNDTDNIESVVIYA